MFNYENISTGIFRFDEALRKVLIIFLLVLLQVQLVSSQSHQLYISPSVFYHVDPSSDFPPVTPLGIIKDQYGNIHSWFFYMEPERNNEIFIQIYYQIALQNGSSIFKLLNRESVFNTHMYFLQKLELVTTNGTTFGIYIRSTDFRTDLMQFGWNPDDGFFHRPLAIPGDPDFQGQIIGPLQEGNYSSFFLATDEVAGPRSIQEIVFDHSSFDEVLTHPFPRTETKGEFERLFDIKRHDNTTYYLGGEIQHATRSSLRVVKHTSTGFEDYGLFTINVKPQVPELPFFSAVLTHLILPQLEITDNGNMYTFLFSIAEDITLNYLIQWNSTGYDLVFDRSDNPFEIAFFPQIKAIGNILRLSSLGFQFAQEIFSITADLYDFNTETGLLSREKIEDTAISQGIFLFAMDLTSKEPLGLAATFSTPDYILENNQVLNRTVGSVFIFTTTPLPEIKPQGIRVHFAQRQDTDGEGIDENTYIITIISLLGLIFVTTLYSIRRSQLRMPQSIQKQVEKARDVPDPTVLDLIHSLVLRLLIYFKTNRRRVMLSIFILIIPSLLIMSTFMGLMSHQEYLIHTYENKHPINDNRDLAFDIGDFVWTRSFYNDELSNNSFSDAEWEIPRQLSALALETFDVNHTVGGLSTTTILTLFEKRQVTFLNNQDENETVVYPIPREVGVVDSTWRKYLDNQLLRGRLPQNSHEVLLQEGWYTSRDPYNPAYEFGNIWNLGSEIPVQASELDIYLNTTIESISQNLTVVGVVGRVESLQFSEIEHWAEDLDTTVSALRFLDTLPFYIFPTEASDLIESFSRLSLRPTTYVDIRYDVFSIERDDIPGVIESYDQLEEIILQETGFTWLGNYTDNRVIPFLEGYYESSRDIQLQTTILVVPALILIILLTYESLGVTRLSMAEEFERFRTLGIRFEQMIFLVLIQRTLQSMMATSIAVLLLKPFLHHLLRFTGFFGTEPIITPPIAQNYLLAIALINFVSLSVIGIVASVIIYFRVAGGRRRQNRLSGFQQDLLILIGALVLFAIASGMNSVFEDQLRTENEFLSSSTELITLELRLLSQLVMSFAGVVITLKVLTRVYISLGHLVWKLKPTKFALIAKGISSNMGIYGKNALVFFIALFLIVPMIVVPQSLEAKYTELGYLELGTDLIVENTHTLDQDTFDQLASLKAVETMSNYYFGEVQFAGNVRFRILAIDPSTFFSSIYIPNRYSDDFAYDKEQIERLQPLQIATNTEFTQRNPLSIGDNFTLAYPHHQQNTTFMIKSLYNKFPVLHYELQGLEDLELVPLQMVITLETLAMIRSGFSFNATPITSEVADSMDQRSSILRLHDSDSEEATISTIKKLTGLRTTHLSSYVQQYRHPFFRLFEFISHLSLVLSFLAPPIASLVFANVMFDKRKLELEVYRRNGISHPFFLGQMVAELTITSILPSLLALPLGAWWTEQYGPDLFGEDPVNLPWQINLILIYMLVLLVLFFSILIWIVRMFTLAQQHIKEVRI